MAAVIAHEIRNSLTSMKLILQYFSESQKFRARKEKESIKVGMSSIHRLESIVSDLLNYAKPREMRFRAQDINQVVKEGIIFSRHQFERKRLSLVEELSPHLPKLMIDAESLKEVIVNLLLNAAHAVTEEKGVVKIKTASSHLGETLREPFPDYRFSSQRDSLATPSLPRGASVQLEKGSKVVTIEIADNRVGIAPQHLQRIFDPFFTTKTEGTGLGLTMARRVVSDHGGAILVESGEGKGSTFRIILPLRSEEQ